MCYMAIPMSGMVMVVIVAIVDLGLVGLGTAMVAWLLVCIISSAVILGSLVGTKS